MPQQNPRMFDQINVVIRETVPKVLASLNDFQFSPQKFFVSDYMRIMIFKTLLTLEWQKFKTASSPAAAAAAAATPLAITTGTNNEMAIIMNLTRFLIVQNKSLLDTNPLHRVLSLAETEKRKQYLEFANSLKTPLDSLIQKLLIFLNEFEENRDEVGKLCKINEFELLDLNQTNAAYDFDDFNEMLMKWTMDLSTRDTLTASSVLKQIIDYEKRNLVKRFELIPIKIECNLIRMSCTSTEEKYLELYRPLILGYLRKFDESIEKQRDLFKMIIGLILDLKLPYNFYEYFRNDFLPFLYDDAKFWQMIFELEIEKEYKKLAWVPKFYINRQSFENCMKVVDIFCKKHAKSQTDIQRFIDTVVLVYFERRRSLEELPIENLLEIYEVFEGCTYLNADRYEKYLMTLLSTKAYDDRVRKMALRAVKLHPQSLAVWKAAMTVLHILKDQQMLEKVINAAYVHLPESDRWQIVMQQIDLLLFDKENFQLANNIYLKAIKLPQTYISRPISIMYLRWLNFTRPINEVRNFYDSFIEQNDPNNPITDNIGFVEEMLDIESLTKPIDKPRVCHLYEFLIWHDNRCGNESFFKWIAEYYYFLNEQEQRLFQQQEGILREQREQQLLQEQLLQQQLQQGLQGQQGQEQGQQQQQQRTNNAIVVEDFDTNRPVEEIIEDDIPQEKPLTSLSQLLEQLKRNTPVDCLSKFESIEKPDFDLTQILKTFDLSQNYRIDFPVMNF